MWLQASQRCHVKDILLQQVSIENIPCFEFLRKGTFLCTSLCNSNRFLLQAISGLAWICRGLALVPTEKTYVLYHHQQVSLHSLKNVTNVFEKILILFSMVTDTKLQLNYYVANLGSSWDRGHGGNHAVGYTTIPNCDSCNLKDLGQD